MFDCLFSAISKPKSSSKAAKPVYPVPKVDSWMVRSPRNAGNTQYVSFFSEKQTKSATKEFLYFFKKIVLEQHLGCIEAHEIFYPH